MEDNIKSILGFLGEDLNREGLKQTPKRYLNFLQEFLSVPEFNFTTFDSEGMDEMIVVSPISFYSMCEHHLVPFFGQGSIAYIPDKKIVGLSKLPRVLEMFSRRFQNQERITSQVAEYIQEKLDPKGVAVVLKAQHLCMQMRGVKKEAFTTTSKMLGSFKNHPSCREEFLEFIK